MSKKQGLYHLVADNDTIDDDAATSTKSVGRKGRILLFVTFCALVILLVLVGIGLALHFTVFKKNTKESDSRSDCITATNICNSKILDYIDDNVDPCHDFYNYSCGNWLAANPLNNNSATGTFYSLALDNYDHLMGYLSQPVSEGDSAAIKKTKYIYSACKDVDFIRNNSVKHLQDFINSSGGWAAIGIAADSGWSINDDLVNDHYLGSSAFFGFSIQPDDLNSSKPIIKVRSYACKK